MIKFVYFGSSKFSEHVLGVLKQHGYEPILNITSAKAPLFDLPEADVYIVASFGKILPKAVIDKPKYKTLNVHPSLLPKLRGPSPIQGAILSEDKTGVTIMRMNEEMDEGPIVAQKEVPFAKWPERYIKVEEVLGKAGGELLVEILPKWINGEIKEEEQNSAEATYTKLINKEDGDISKDSGEVALKKIYAYEVWPRARRGDLIITDAHLEKSELVLDKVIPAGKKEMLYVDYLRGKH